MGSQERSNRLEWITSELERLHDEVMDNHFPSLRGLPADDPHILVAIVENADDEDLVSLAQMGQAELIEWARQQMQDFVRDSWFGEDAIDVLVQHVGDLLVDHPDLPEKDIELSVRYYAKRASTLELIDRFDDDAEKWLTLMKLAREDDSDAEGRSSEQ